MKSILTILISFTFAFSAEGRLYYRQYTTDDGLAGNTVRSILQDSKGNIWMGTLNGLSRLGDEGFTLFQAGKGEAPALSDNRIYKLREDKVGRLWISTASRVYSCYDLKQDKFIKFDSVPNFINDMESETISKDGVTTIFDNLGRKWTYNHTGNLTFHLANGKEKKTYALIPKKVLKSIDHERYHVVSDEKEDTWISTYGNGLFRLNENTGKLTHYISENGQQGHIPSDYIRYMTKDRDGSIWIATEYSGVTKIWEATDDFDYIFPNDDHTMPRANSVRMVAPADNENFSFLVGNKTGDIFRWNSEEGEMKIERSFPSNVYAVMTDNKGNTWYGTRGSGLFIGNDNFRFDKNDPLSLPNDNIFYIHNDRKGRIWIGTFGGGTALSIQSPSGKISFKSFIDDQHGLKEHRCLTEDVDGRFWIGTSDGVVTFHPDSILKDKDAFRVHSISGSALSTSDIRDMMRDSKGRLWIASGNAGIFVASTTSSGDLTVVRTFTSEDGLPSNSIQASIEDKSGNIWISTEAGMAMIDSNYTVESHIFSNEALRNVFSEAALAMTKNGRIVAGTNDGVLLFNPKDFIGHPGNHDANVLLEPNESEEYTSHGWYLYLIILTNVIIAGVLIYLLVRYGWRAERWKGEKRKSKPENDYAPSADKLFLERLESVAMANLGNTTFSMDDFAAELNVGRAVFYRRLRSLLNVSPNDYLKNLRLEKAAEMLKNNPDLNIAEIADKVGFSDSLYFSKCFKGKYGLSPSSFRKDNLSKG